MGVSGVGLGLVFTNRARQVRMGAPGRADSVHQGARDEEEKKVFFVLITFNCIYISTAGFD